MNQLNSQPLIVAFVSDLLFTMKINNVIKHLNYRVQWVEDPSQIGGGDLATTEEALGEKLHGLEGQLFEKITDWQPGLLLFDLANQDIPWEKWIPALKSSPATRRIPIMAFGPHTNVEMMQSAKAAGANPVLARSAFTADMPQLLQSHVRKTDYDALQQTCLEPLSPLAVTGIEKFNQGAFYACHDDLEEAWVADDSAGRDLYRGILQVGIAYFQIERGNYRGALKMLLRVRQWLDPLPAVCRGVDVAALRDDASAVQEALTALGPDRVDEFNRQLFRPIAYKT